jgi:hypothetical protein
MTEQESAVLEGAIRALINLAAPVTGGDVRFHMLLEWLCLNDHERDALLE